MPSDTPFRLPDDDSWARISEDLDLFGAGVAERVLDSACCRELGALFDEDRAFRKRIDMERHGFGRGAYAYFCRPLPPAVQALREVLYPPLAALANDWGGRLGWDSRFPERHESYLGQCRAAGQEKPTPLLLRYRAGDYNRLHQDLYGPCVFPFQATILLSRPGEDFEGGEFVLAEQSPRRQSRAEVVPLRQGDAVFFPVRERPARGGRGDYKVAMRHGVSRVRSGERVTLGIIFHDAA
jgi:hypothetical protein